MNSKRRFINVNYTMSYEEHEEGFTMPEFHFHNDYEIYILEKGKRIVSIGDDTFMTGAGDAVLFAGEVPHKSKGSEGFAGICIHFSERYLKRYFTIEAINRFKSIFDARMIHISDAELSVIRKMTENFVTEDEDNFFRLVKVFEILNDEMRNVEVSHNIQKTDNNEAVKKKNRKAEDIFTYVEENYAYIKTASELAEYFDVSESYIFRIFRKKYDMTLKTYINKLRIKNICKCMKYSERTIKNLAAEYGFESYEYFNRVFKKEKGCSPRDYCKLRKQNIDIPQILTVQGQPSENLRNIK